MRLVEVRVQKFRNFDDSDKVAIEPDVTALVGKNESGKTAFLQALHRLKPDHGEQFEELDHYPRWLYNAVVPGTVPPLTEADLTGTDRIIKRIERARGAFSHGSVADHLLRDRTTVLSTLSSKTLDNFEALFERINDALPSA
jgi:predicted ATP-dependent endonuclease of OLD family